MGVYVLDPTLSGNDGSFRWKAHCNGRSLAFLAFDRKRPAVQFN